MHFLFQRADLFSQLSISTETFLNFAKEIQAGYIATNPYHNATHAADVTQTFHYMMYTAGAIKVANLTNSDVAA
jgi:calcium/calmodulin-dependent 3',5'-cyclic nucleotide phosphodiesterase